LFKIFTSRNKRKGLVVFVLRFGAAWGWICLRPVSHSCYSPTLCKNSAIWGNNEELGGEVTGFAVSGMRTI